MVSPSRSKSIQKSGIDLDSKTTKFFAERGFYIDKKIGEGSFGKVYRGTKKTKSKSSKKSAGEELIAVKMMDIRKIDRATQQVYLPRELEALTSIHHKSVVRTIEIIKAHGFLFIFMEFCPNGDIAHYVEKHSTAGETNAQLWFQQSADALHYIHHVTHMVHRDIKMDNVLLDKNFNAKLTDFGFAKLCWNKNEKIVQMSESYCGTAPYMAPQILQRGRYNPYLADGWALGIMLYLMLEGEFMFFGEANEMVPLMLDYPDYVGKKLDRMKQRASTAAKKCVFRFLDPDEKTRMTFSQLMQEDYMKR